MGEITYFDRYQGRVCQEVVYGDKALRWVYGTTIGQVSLHALVKRTLFSRWYGWLMDRPSTKKKIAPFIEDYHLDADEFVRCPDDFLSFNDFFSRALKPEARPIDSSSQSIVFPADGRHLCIPELSRGDGLFVKGETFDLRSLLADDDLASRYAEGSLLLSRLCPVDYHRFHFPASGSPGEVRLINGPLYSVNPVALRKNIEILATNKRTITTLQTDDCGRVLLIEVGATCVGSIRQTFRPDARVKKGDEKGYFRFGGSSTITIFEPGRVTFAADLVEQSSRRRELYARMGDSAGVIS